MDRLSSAPPGRMASFPRHPGALPPASVRRPFGPSIACHSIARVSIIYVPVILHAAELAALLACISHTLREQRSAAQKSSLGFSPIARCSRAEARATFCSGHAATPVAPREESVRNAGQAGL